MRSHDRPVKPLELWAGVECTVNRVHDRYFDQLERSGHAARIGDLNRLASLGIRTLRYPLLWERLSNAAVNEFRWDWADERVARLRDLGMTPIAGLVHHGSGPMGTSLVERTFSGGLAKFAGQVASRYPWIRDYTPVNEPLTTARFSGLYGHWYPHGRDALTFGQAFLEQCRGVVLAMRAIREVRPDARLVQTDDLGKTHSTLELRHQADFENERRWLTWDLLSGRVTREHPMWGYLRWAGVPEHELAWFLDHACPPDIIGINHYLTSERFLDHRTHLYPAHTLGGNGTDEYADVEAVRARADGADGWDRLLDEACARYDCPVAITEVHNGCTREEQVRWLVDAWTAAERVHASGGGVIAVTAWAAFGACDWNSLVTRETNHYEPGLFDLRSPDPRPTALARVVRSLASGAAPDHPLLDVPGWWRRPERLIFGVSYPEAAEPRVKPIHTIPGSRGARPILITGKTGTLGRAFARICDLRGIPYRLLGRDELDIGDPASVERDLPRFEPWAVVNAAGYVRVDDAEGDRDRCFRENTWGPAILARCCAAAGIQLATFSSDLVFDGTASRPYVETDVPAPLNVYGDSKVEAERQVLAAMPDALVIRTSAFFGPWDDHNFVTRCLRTLAAGGCVHASADTVSPTYVPDLVTATMDLLIDEESGIWHLANAGETTWRQLAKRAAERAGLDSSAVTAASARRLGQIARRPHYSPLSSARGAIMPSLEDALDRYVRELSAGTELAAAESVS